MFHRLSKPLKSNSFFLFGARGTGKSTFLKEFFSKENALWIDLLDPLEEDIFARDPEELKRRVLTLTNKKAWVVIDEVQKVPKLLNVVHQLIEGSEIRFALTGSSARKLKRGSANLLAGRAFVNHLFPLTHLEMKDAFDLIQALQWGTLPKITQLTSDEEKIAYLKSYALTYLKEEVWGEQVIRRLDPFRKFLEIAAQTHGEILNYSNIARDVGVDTKTIQSYFEILEDTLIGFHLPAYHRSVRKQQHQAPKFFYFDMGVKRALEGTLTQSVLPQTYGFGKAFEQFLIMEIIRLNDYLQKDYRFSYLLTKEGAEIDLIVERPGKSTALIEMKSAIHVDERDTRTIETFLDSFHKAEGFCFSQDPQQKKIGRVLALPWHEGLREIGLFPASGVIKE